MFEPNDEVLKGLIPHCDRPCAAGETDRHHRSVSLTIPANKDRNLLPVIAYRVIQSQVEGNLNSIRFTANRAQSRSA